MTDPKQQPEQTPAPAEMPEVTIRGVGVFTPPAAPRAEPEPEPDAESDDADAEE